MSESSEIEEKSSINSFSLVVILIKIIRDLTPILEKVARNIDKLDLIMKKSPDILYSFLFKDFQEIVESPYTEEFMSEIENFSTNLIASSKEKKASSRQKVSHPPISIIIPSLNEEEAIKQTIADIQKQNLPNVEILVVDGLSADRTQDFARKMGAKIIVEHRRGYGRAIQTGVENAKGDILIWMDADFSYPAKYLSALIQPIIERKADIVLGNRLRKLEYKSMTPSHLFGNVILTIIFNIFYGKRIKDTQCGLRAFSRRGLEKMNLEKKGMSYATEILIEAVKKNLKIEQIDISYRKRIGETKLNTFKDGINILLTIIQNRFRKKS
ncbi:MAG: glycosyltransferase family 2 protein [Candidatus Helarchaeota archaeon]